MFERSRQADESSQIQDPEEANFTVLNVPYRLLSGNERGNLERNDCAWACCQESIASNPNLF
jgi:hypothetical protein